MRLEGRVAVITGAAAGLGKAAAIRLSTEGATAELIDIKDSTGVRDEIRAAGGKADSIVCDCTDEAQIAAAVSEIEARHGRVDILVNNAGILSNRKPWHT